MSVPVYDVFSGTCEYDAVWLETAPTLDTACEHMKRFAATSPGPYFVICYDTGVVVAQLNTMRNDPLLLTPAQPTSRFAPKRIDTTRAA
jgi:hypothetical protein